jgi:hypothetical protein
MDFEDETPPPPSPEPGGIARFFEAHKKRILVIGSVSFCVVVAVMLGVRQYMHQQWILSPEYAVERLRNALVARDREEAARMIDFSDFSAEIFKNILDNYPFLAEKPEFASAQSVPLVRDGVLSALDLKPTSNEPQTGDSSPLRVFPDDFSDQLGRTLKIGLVSGDEFVASASAWHAQLAEDFNLLMLFRRNADSWSLVKLLNAEEVVKNFRAAQLERMKRRQRVFVYENTLAEDNMNRLFPVRDCVAGTIETASPEMIGLRLHVFMSNRSDAVQESGGLAVSVYVGSYGNAPVFERILDGPFTVRPDDDLEYERVVRLDATTNPGAEIRESEWVRCKARWQGMKLSNGSSYSLVDVPELIEDFQ